MKKLLLLALLFALPAQAQILEAIGTTSPTTGSSTYVLMTDMTISPAAGEYLAVFSTVVENDTAGAILRCALFVGGSVLAHTEREFLNELDIIAEEVAFGTHAHVTVAASEAVELKWKTTAGTSTARKRALILFPIASAGDVDQAIDTVNDTLDSSTSTLLDTMTITPGAGDYLLVFSTSGQGPGGTVLTYEIFVGGTEPSLANSRKIEQNSSTPNTSFHLMMAAKVSPTGGQAVEIKWRRSVGSGTITSHERTLTLVKVSASNIKDVKLQADSTSTSTTDELMNTMQHVDPGVGPWLALFTSYYRVGTITVNVTNFNSFFVGGSKIVNSERQPRMEESLDNTQIPYFNFYKVSPGATDDVEVFWRGSTTDQRVAKRRGLVLIREAPVGGDDDLMILARREH